MQSVKQPALPLVIYLVQLNKCENFIIQLMSFDSSYGPICMVEAICCSKPGYHHVSGWSLWRDRLLLCRAAFKTVRRKKTADNLGICAIDFKQDHLYANGQLPSTNVWQFFKKSTTNLKHWGFGKKPSSILRKKSSFLASKLNELVVTNYTRYDKSFEKKPGVLVSG